MTKIVDGIKGRFERLYNDLKKGTLVGICSLSAYLNLTGCSYSEISIYPVRDKYLGRQITLEVPAEVERVVYCVGPHTNAGMLLKSFIRAYNDFPAYGEKYGEVILTDIEGDENPIMLIINGRIDTKTTINEEDKDSIFQCVLDP